MSASYANVAFVPVNAVPSQTLSVTLNGQAIGINIYTRGGYLFMDVFLNGALKIAGRICQTGNKIIRNDYIGIDGEFVWWDAEGNDDPQYAGLGSRWLLAYYS